MKKEHIEQQASPSSSIVDENTVKLEGTFVGRLSSTKQEKTDSVKS